MEIVYDWQVLKKKKKKNRDWYMLRQFLFKNSNYYSDT